MLSVAKFFGGFRTASDGAKRRCSTNAIIVLCSIIMLIFVQSSEALTQGEDTHLEAAVPKLQSNLSKTTSTTAASVDSEEDYYDDNAKNGTSWKERNWRRQDNSKIAQVVVYFSVIVIAFAGVLIKYFVTHYETSQLRAQEQLDYQRLQNA